MFCFLQIIILGNWFRLTCEIPLSLWVLYIFTTTILSISFVSPEKRKKKKNLEIKAPPLSLSFNWNGTFFTFSAGTTWQREMIFFLCDGAKKKNFIGGEVLFYWFIGWRVVVVVELNGPNPFTRHLSSDWPNGPWQWSLSLFLWPATATMMRPNQSSAAVFISYRRHMLLLGCQVLVSFLIDCLRAQ